MKPKRTLIRICLLCAAALQAATSGAQPVTKIAGGDYNSLFLKSDGSLWVTGDSSSGQLGDGTYGTTNRFEQIVVSDVATVDAGLLHSLFLKNDGSLWSMGRNLEGQLGDGTYNTSAPYGTNRPEQIIASGVTAVAAGGYHSLFIKSDGSLWAMGGNSEGELGDGTNNNTNRPEQIVASGVTAVAAGHSFTLFVRSDGSLWAMGWNLDGQFGDGTYNSTNRPKQILGSGVATVAAGARHSLFLKNNGSLWAMGYNGKGQLGDGTARVYVSHPEMIVASGVTAIAAGGYHSLFLKSDGSLWGMGYNSYGQLGDGNYITNAPYGTNRPEQIVASGVTAIAAGGWHSLFIKSDGSAWVMGYNSLGQLGDGTTNSVNLPEQIVADPPGYNRISAQLLTGGNMRLSFAGIAGTNYALDRSFSLTPADWVPVTTNPAGSNGILVITNTPDTAINFWRMRWVR